MDAIALFLVACWVAAIVATGVMSCMFFGEAVVWAIRSKLARRRKPDINDWLAGRFPYDR